MGGQTVALLNTCKIKSRVRSRNKKISVSRGKQWHASGLVYGGGVDFSMGQLLEAESLLPDLSVGAVF